MSERQRDSVFDPDLLARCISCGFCLPACPTYAMTGDEASSPRGRITLMRALETGELPADDPTLREQSSFCLGCRACEPVCPAGVQYGQLLEQWRVHQWRGRRRPLLARLVMLVAARESLLRLLGRLRGAARTRGADVTRGGARTRAGALTRVGVASGAVAGAGEPTRHLMLGCFERGLFPKVSRAARRLVPGLPAPDRQGCCGALHAHNGDLATGEAMAHRLGQRLPGTIVTTSGGCAAHLATVLGRERVRELSEELSGKLPTTDPGEVRVGGRRARVTLQDSCHLRNGLGVAEQPRALLRAVADYVELPDAGACCGAAGTYSLVRPRDAGRVLAPKLARIADLDVDYVVAVNPGCLRQLQTGLRRSGSRARAVHLAELLAMASGPAGSTPTPPDGRRQGRRGRRRLFGQR
jgi:glycolate oxidase iron-sulfur subunit